MTSSVEVSTDSIRYWPRAMKVTGLRTPNPKNMALTSSAIGRWSGNDTRNLMAFSPQVIEGSRRNLGSSLEDMSDSFFEPGGSRRNPNTGFSGNKRPTVHFGETDLPSQNREAFERNKRREIQMMNEEFDKINLDLTRLVEARNQAQDEHEIMKRDMEEQRERLEDSAMRRKEKFERREQEYNEVCQSLKRQADELKENRDEQIEENERTRHDILEENECLMGRREQAAFEVAELEQRKFALEDFVNKTESYWRNPDVSVIPSSGENRCADVDSSVSSHTLGQQTSSTPAHRRSQDARCDQTQQRSDQTATQSGGGDVRSVKRGQ